MAPLPEPGPSAPICRNCGFPLPEPKPAFCPRCGASLRERPLWLTLIAALGAVFLGFAAVGLGGFGACVALFAASESGGLFNSDALWIWGMLIGAVLCLVASLAILIWLMKKPKPK